MLLLVVHIRFSKSFAIEKPWLTPSLSYAFYMLVYRPKYLWWEGACITIVCLITPLPKAEFYNLPNWIAPLEKGLPFFCWNPFKAHQFIYGSLGHRQVKPGSSQGSSMDARSGAEITYFLFACYMLSKSIVWTISVLCFSLYTVEKFVTGRVSTGSKA